MYKAIFFDLDGTLTESGEGITKSVQYALEKLGVSASDLEPLKVFVGPPLLDQFMKYAGFDKETAQKGIEYYRERYSEKGMYENTVYPGVENALAELKRRGYRLAVASAKPTFYVTQIMDHFNLSRYFEVIAGTDLNGPKVSKSQVIEEALERMNLSDHRDQVIMVGDREHDILGARRCGIQCVAVSYGYGSREELEAAQPLQIVAYSLFIPSSLLIQQNNAGIRCIDRNQRTPARHRNRRHLLKLAVTHFHLTNSPIRTGQFPDKQKVCQCIQAFLIQCIRQKTSSVKPCKLFIDSSPLQLLKQVLLQFPSQFLRLRILQSSVTDQITIESRLLFSGQRIMIIKIQNYLPGQKPVIVIRKRIHKIFIEIRDPCIQFHTLLIPDKRLLVRPLSTDISCAHSSNRLPARNSLIAGFQKFHRQK